MKVFSRYLLKEFLGFLAMFTGAFTVIFLMVDFVQKVDNFIESGAPAWSMAAYFGYKIPFIVVQMVPVATLLAAIVMFSIMARHNEITAMRSCGMSALQIARPVVYGSVTVAVFVFALFEMAVPYFSTKSNGIWDLYVMRRGEVQSYGEYNVWYKGDDTIYRIGWIDSASGEMNDCSFYFFDDDFSLRRCVDASRVYWSGEKWIVESALSLADAEGGGYSLERMEYGYLDIPEKPDDFKNEPRKPEEMNYRELKKYAGKIRAEGYNPTPYLVDMHIKPAFPFIVVVLAAMGLPIVLKIGKQRTALAVCAGIGLCFLYLVVLGLCRSMGISGMLPPVVAAWTANGVFLLGSVYALMRAE
ncbi:MAG TPA: LPS export ABC transporter permease LptG [Desulfobacteraceae bacterium]|nr:LPS export ABC transporter permease LptG [Desulfobacteraceae bacterium]